MRAKQYFLAWGLVLTCVLSAAGAANGETAPPPSATKPIVIAHRGASGYRPEHTIEAYRLAIEQGADFIEPDLVSTKDGQLIARHEPLLAIVDPTTGRLIEETTNVRELSQFADRVKTRTLDGEAITGWWAQDFTLAEIKTLRARERIPKLRPTNAEFNDRFTVPTLQEVIDLAKAESARTGRTIGLYPETKHPTYHAAAGLPLEERLVETLQKNGLDSALAPVFIQSFETGNLQRLRSLTRCRLVQLVSASGRPFDWQAAGDRRTYADLVSPSGLADVKRYADGIGPDKAMVLSKQDASETSLVRDAHAAGLLVHPYSLRRENQFLPRPFDQGNDAAAAGDLAGEVRAMLRAGVDGFFTDNPDIGATVVKEAATQAAAAN